MTDFGDITSAFTLEGDFSSCEPHGSGHIHDTYLLELNQGNTTGRFILQRLNTHVFPKPRALQDNLRRILDFLHKKISGDPGGPVYPELVETQEGENYLVDNSGNYWRCYRYIEGSRSHKNVESPELAYEGGRLFGLFSAHLEDYDPRRLHITIPGFLDPELRLRQLIIARTANPAGRLNHVSSEFSKLLENQHISSEFTRIRMALPERVAHNDTKISNILFSKATGKGICVIDLDTVMTGTLLTDFGDMVRTFTASTTEDDTNLADTGCEPDLFKALYQGFMSSVKDFISDVEYANLLLGAKLMIYMQAVRFLTDYLNGDVYYKTGHRRHNLDRARNQLTLLDTFIGHEQVFKGILERNS